MDRALVVGISDYGRLNQSLPGCLNDMDGWRDYLAGSFALGADNLRLLADSRATREAILARIGWLLDDARDGDRQFFVFAGHGSRLRRRDPDTGIVEHRLDETLVAYPGAADDFEDFMIFDEDLAQLVDRSGFPPDARLTFIFNSCHSGGMLRELLLGVEAPADTPLPRYLRVPDDVRAREFQDDRLEVRALGTLASSTLRVPRLIVAAAKAEQSAWDARMPDGQRHGVFSFYALRELAKAPHGAMNDILASTARKIATHFPQTPMLLGSENRFNQPLTE